MAAAAPGAGLQIAAFPAALGAEVTGLEVEAVEWGAAEGRALGRRL